MGVRDEIQMFKSAIPAKYMCGAIIGVAIIIIIALSVSLWLGLKNHEQKAEQLKKAIAVTEMQASSINDLQNKFELSKKNAENLSKLVEQAKSGNVIPVARFSVSAESPAKATQKVANMINTKDTSLPPQVLEKTDNTLVYEHKLSAKEVEAVKKENSNINDSAKKLNEEFGVNVIKNNNYRNWYVGTGIGTHDGDTYIPISLQRNFSKDSALEIEAHINHGITGGEIKYKRAIDKLFIIL